MVSLIHSVDSLRLLNAINQLQGELDPQQQKRILLEVNVSGDSAKHGFEVEQIAAAVAEVQQCDHVLLSGLMCMAGLGTTPDEARHDFARLRELRDDLQQQFPNCDLSELSMGMSSDFEAAIAEGATLVRVGSTLFRNL